MNTSPRLMPLRIPSGWAIFHNRFFDVDPIIQADWIINDSYFDEDLLWIEQMEFSETGWRQRTDGYFFDLGWLPSANPNGCYRLQLFRGSREIMLLSYSSRQREIIRRVLEHSIGFILNGINDTEITLRIQQQFG